MHKRKSLCASVSAFSRICLQPKQLQKPRKKKLLKACERKPDSDEKAAELQGMPHRQASEKEREKNSSFLNRAFSLFL